MTPSGSSMRNSGRNVIYGTLPTEISNNQHQKAIAVKNGELFDPRDLYVLPKGST